MPGSKRGEGERGLVRCGERRGAKGRKGRGVGGGVCARRPGGARWRYDWWKERG